MYRFSKSKFVCLYNYGVRLSGILGSKIETRGPRISSENILPANGNTVVLNLIFGTYSVFFKDFSIIV